MTKPIEIYQSSMLLQLPDILLDSILSYLTFNEIANLRIVCQKFNENCKRLLNRGFRTVEQYHVKCQKEVKAQLPRRESERRDHPLAHHCNILSGIETRLSLLNMTFLKYVDAKFCCFIPGKVIDEIYRVLRFVQNTKRLFIEGNLSNESRNSILKELRANVILKELRDISSMAMEHFEEKILPAFKPPTSSSLISFFSSSPPHFSPSVSPFVSLSPGSGGIIPSIEPSTSTASEQITHLGNLKLYSKQNKSHINTLKKQYINLQNKLNEACRKISEQDQVILELNRVLTEQTSKLSDHENKLSEVNRKLMENEQKLTAILGIMNSSGYPSPGFTFSAEAKNSSGGTTSSKAVSITTNVGASTSGIHMSPSYQPTTFFLTPGVVQPTIIPMGLTTSQTSCMTGNLSLGIAGFSPPLALPPRSPSHEPASFEKDRSRSPPKPEPPTGSEPRSLRGRRKRVAPCYSSKEPRCKRQR